MGALSGPKKPERHKESLVDRFAGSAVMFLVGVLALHFGWQLLEPLLLPLIAMVLVAFTIRMLWSAIERRRSGW